MLKPSFRSFVIPLGAICTLASLSSQQTPPREPGDRSVMQVRHQVTDCNSRNVAAVCVIASDGAAVR